MSWISCLLISLAVMCSGLSALLQVRTDKRLFRELERLEKEVYDLKNQRADGGGSGYRTKSGLHG